MNRLIITLTDGGEKVFRSIIVAALVTGLFIFALWVSLDKKIEIIKPLDEMQYVNKVWDSEECYYIFKYKEGHNRWYRLITIDDSTSFVSHYPAIIDCGDDLLIRVRWNSNKYVDCETFLRIAGKYNGLFGKGEVGFCKRYHLPLNKIKEVCGGF